MFTNFFIIDEMILAWSLGHLYMSSISNIAAQINFITVKVFKMEDDTLFELEDFVDVVVEVHAGDAVVDF